MLWSNDHTELYGHDEIAQMVLDAETSMPGDSETNNASSDTEAFPVGTRVYKEFEDDTYYYGQGKAKWHFIECVCTCLLDVYHVFISLYQLNSRKLRWIPLHRGLGERRYRNIWTR